MREPQRLQEEEEAVQAEMEQLAFLNYKSFVQTSECIGELHSGIKGIGGHLQGLRAALSRFSAAAQEFATEAQQIEAEWEVNGAALERHARIVEILEVPQLMDTCVRNGYYEEALQLQQYANQLHRKHPGIPIIANMADDVRATADVMLEQLHSQLRGNIQVTACLRVIGFLRRLEVYDESQLRVSFLKCREAWLAAEEAKIPSQNAYTYLNKLVDQTRGSLFDIITQYRAIFAEGAKGEAAILHSWLVHQVRSFISQLTNGLARITDGGSVHQVLDQCMYLGMSLSRVGVDFRGLLPPIFEAHVLKLFSSAVQRATSTFVQSIRTGPLASAARSNRPPLLADRPESLAPSHALLQYPALALLTNELLSAFNELRQCAPASVIEKVAAELQEALAIVTGALASPRSQLSGQEKEQHEGLCRTVAELFLPYIDRCLAHVFHATGSLLGVEQLVADLSRLYAKEEPAH